MTIVGADLLLAIFSSLFVAAAICPSVHQGAFGQKTHPPTPPDVCNNALILSIILIFPSIASFVLHSFCFHKIPSQMDVELWWCYKWMGCDKICYGMVVSVW